MALRELVYSPFSDINLVSIYLCWTEIVLKFKKSTNFFALNVWKIFILVLTSLKMHETFKREQFLVEK